MRFTAGRAGQGMARIGSLAAVAALLLPGCKVVDAPEDIETLMIFGFTHANEEDDSYGTAFLDNLLPEIEAHSEDLEAGYRVNSLSTADIEAAGADPGEDVEIMGVASRVFLESSIGDIAWGLTFPDTTQIYEATKVFELLENSDRDCFVAQTCPSYTYRAHRVLDLGVLGEATQDFDGSFRWAETEDGRKAIVWRALAPDPAIVTSNLMSVHQQYSIDAFFEDDSGQVSRVSAIWIDATLGEDGDLPDSFLINQAVTQLQEGADDLDLFIAENRDKDESQIGAEPEDEGCGGGCSAGERPAGIAGIAGALLAGLALAARRR